MKTRRPSVRLHIEELESRLAPSVSTVTSTNWSGYAVQSSNNSVSSVSGSWTVPAITGSGYAAVWVGIDGFANGTVEQVGTESQVVNGQVTYYAWYEMYPNPVRNLAQINPTYAITPGDAVSASVTSSDSTSGGSSSSYTLTLTNTTKAWTYTTTASTATQNASAEWIVEAPTISNGRRLQVAPLGDFGTVGFSNAQATVSGTTGAIDAFPNGYRINMGDPSGGSDTTGLLTDSSGSSNFSVSFNVPVNHHKGGPSGPGSGFGPNQTDSGQGTATAAGTSGSDLASAVNLALASGQLNQATTQAQQANAAAQTQPIVAATALPAIPAAAQPTFFVGRVISAAQSLPESTPDSATGKPASVTEPEAPKAADPAGEPMMPKANPEGAGNPIVPAGPQAQPQGVWDGDLVWRADEAGRMELRWANAAGAATGKNESNADTVLDTMLALGLSVCWIHGKEEEEIRRRRTDFGAIA